VLHRCAELAFCWWYHGYLVRSLWRSAPRTEARPGGYAAYRARTGRSTHSAVGGEPAGSRALSFLHGGVGGRMQTSPV